MYPQNITVRFTVHSNIVNSSCAFHALYKQEAKYKKIGLWMVYLAPPLKTAKKQGEMPIMQTLEV